MQQKRSSLGTWGIFIGLLLGGLIGLLFYELKGNPQYAQIIAQITDNIFFPVGNLFLSGLFMVIVPLVFSSLIVGVADMSNPTAIGRLSKRLLIFYASSTLIAIFIGQILMGVIRPGDNISPEASQKAAVTMQAKMSSLKEKSSMVGTSLWPGILSKIVPRNIIDQFGENNMLAVIFVSLLFGLSLLYMPNGPAKETFIHMMTALSNLSVIIIKWIMKTAPYAVAALIAGVFAEVGWPLIQSLMTYILVITLGLLLHVFGTYSLFLKFLVRIPIREFFARMVPVFYTAFGTSSSSATMPVTMDTLERKFGVPRSIVSFSIPIGTVVNMDGTALFEVAAALFIAQIFGVHLTASSIVILVSIVFITSIGVAGVPGGSIPILMSSIVVLGIPAEGIAIILGVDRLMDMCRTVVNVTGDSVVTLYLSRKENVDIQAYIDKHPR